MERLFLDCPVARVLCDLSGLEYLSQGLPRHTFPLFLKRLLTLIEQLPLFMAVVVFLWRIWRSRNWVVFEGKQFGILALMQQFSQQYEEWVRLPVNRVTRLSFVLLHPLGHDGASSMVCMWDGATRSGFHLTGGMVIMSHDKEILLVKGVMFPLIDDPMVVELLGLWGAILFRYENEMTPPTRLETKTPYNSHQ
ncbi:unnamed protein product [Linum trigynum]|uniref:Uncharacterized protein n=1 Tax=Linum trigynum TaxID=586398 RepID=A0AAV2FQB6_9ROSI